MSLFLLTYFCIYGTFHLYLFLKARAALHFSLGSSLAAGVIMLAMVAAPVAVRILDRIGAVFPARGLAYLGYIWMGLVFFLVCLNLCADLSNLAMRLIAALTGWPTTRLLFVGKKALISLLVVGLTLGLWATVEAWRIRREHLEVQTDKLPTRIDRLKVVQISDLHLGLMVGEGRLKRILSLVREADPDLLVCTGDLVDAQMDNMNHLASLLDEVRPPLGKFAVTGNHEFYAGIDQSEHFLRLSGFTLLRGARVTPGGLLAVVGVDDPAGSYGRPATISPDRQEAAALTAPGPPLFTLLLKHRPSVQTESLGQFDLQLSGHTHNGQIFPFTLVTRLFYPMQAGLYRLAGGSLIYVSRGAGTWGPPMRFLAPPEVTLITVTRTGGRI
jgi:predicted MPP superfamily phosphohydrolase